MGSTNDLTGLQDDTSTIRVPEEPCPICLQDYDLSTHSVGGDISHIPAKTGKCHHYFGLACVLRWYKEHNTCPICRMQQFGEETDETTEPLDDEVALLDQLLLDIPHWRQIAGIADSDHDDCEIAEAFDGETMYLDELMTDMPRWRRSVAAAVSDDDDSTDEEGLGVDDFPSVGYGDGEDQVHAASQNARDSSRVVDLCDCETAVEGEDQGEGEYDWATEALKLFETHQMS